MILPVSLWKQPCPSPYPTPFLIPFHCHQLYWFNVGVFLSIGFIPPGRTAFIVFAHDLQQYFMQNVYLMSIKDSRRIIKNLWSWNLRQVLGRSAVCDSVHMAQTEVGTKFSASTKFDGGEKFGAIKNLVNDRHWKCERNPEFSCNCLV